MAAPAATAKVMLALMASVATRSDLLMTELMVVPVCDSFVDMPALYARHVTAT